MKKSSYYIILFLIFCLIEPSCFIENAKKVGFLGDIHYLYARIRFISFFVSILLFLLIRRPSKIFILILLYHVVILLTSIVNGNFEGGSVYIFATIFSISVITEFFIKHSGLYIFSKALSHFMALLVLINFFTLVFFPDGMYVNERGWTECYFLGYKNDQIFEFLPAIFFAGIISYSNDKKYHIFFHSLLIVILMSCLLNHSTTSLVVTGILTVLYFVYINREIPKWVNIRNLFFLFLILSIFFVIWVLNDSLTDYTSSISEYAGKDIDTIQERGLIWVEALGYIIKRPIIGSGVITFGLNSFYEYGQAHNQYLDTFVIGGLLLFSVFVLQVITISGKLKKNEKIQLYNVALFTFLGYFIEFMAEGRRNNYLWFIVLIAAYHIPKIIKNNRKKKYNNK